MPTHPGCSHHDSSSQRHWVEDELRTLDLGDPRRVRRLKRIAADLLAQPGAVVINIGDREADSYELFLHHRRLRAQGGGSHELLLRCQHDRQLTHNHDGLFSHLQKQPVAAHRSVEVSRRPGREPAFPSEVV